MRTSLNTLRLSRWSIEQKNIHSSFSMIHNTQRAHKHHQTTTTSSSTMSTTSSIATEEHSPFALPKNAWTTPVAQDGWVLSHNALRQELNEIRKGLDACLPLTASTDPANNDSDPAATTTTTTTTTTATTALLEPWKIDYLHRMWKYHADHIYRHHRSEEDILQPFMETRVTKYPDEACEDHDGLESCVWKLNDQMTRMMTSTSRAPTYKSNATANTGSTATLTEQLQEWSDSFNIYQKRVLVHFQCEEQVALPTLRANFTEAECKTMYGRMAQKGGHPGSFVYYIGADVFRNEFMPRRKIPSHAWHRKFGPACRQYETTMIKTRQALEANQEMKPSQMASSNGCCIL